MPSQLPPQNPHDRCCLTNLQVTPALATHDVDVVTNRQ